MKYDFLTDYIDSDCMAKDAIKGRLTYLAELETKIEDGTLVELPYEVGDKVYTIFCNHKGDLFVSETIIAKIGFDKSGIYYISLYDEPLSDIYKTKAEAEAKLKELQWE